MLHTTVLCMLLWSIVYMCLKLVVDAEQLIPDYGPWLSKVGIWC